MASQQPGSGMKISNIQEKKNILMFPIYCMGVFRNFVIIGGGGGTGELPNELQVYDLSNPGDISMNTLKKQLDSVKTEISEVPNYIDVAHNLNVIAVVARQFTCIYKLNVKDGGKLELLQKFQTDFKPGEPSSNCCRWSIDNGALAVAGDDSIIRVYKVSKTVDEKTKKETPDFTKPFELVFELGGSHNSSITQIDISPGKTLLVSASGDDCKACVWDLKTKRSEASLTFRDKNFRDRLGNPTKDNFMIKGAFFTNCGQYIYLLASKFKYGSFLVKFRIHPSQSGIQFSVESVLDVYNNYCNGMRPSRDGSLICIYTCDGFINIVEESVQKVILCQKRHNMPITCSTTIDVGDFVTQDQSEPSHIITASTDYSYNMIPVSGQSSTISNIVSFVVTLVMQVILLYCVLIYAMAYVPAPSQF